MSPQRLQQRSKLQSGLIGPQTRPRDGLARARGVATGLTAARRLRRGGPRYEAGHDGLDDLAVAALATLPPQKAASILTKLRNKGGNVRNPSAYVVRSVENAHCHGGGVP